MDFFVARAMQMACLNDMQITMIHSRERERGYCIANADIQHILGLQPIKDIHLIYDEGETPHAQRIKHALLSLRIAQDVEGEEMDREGQPRRFCTKPWDAITIGNVGNTHDFDIRVYEAVRSGVIDFVFSGGSTKKTGSLAHRVRSGKEAAGV